MAAQSPHNGKVVGSNSTGSFEIMLQRMICLKSWEEEPNYQCPQLIWIQAPNQSSLYNMAGLLQVWRHITAQMVFTHRKKFRAKADNNFKK